MKTHQVNCPICKAKKSITWTTKTTTEGVMIYIHKCIECGKVSDVVNEPKLREYKDQLDCYLD